MLNMPSHSGSHFVKILYLTTILLLPLTLASSGDRNPTFQHCLRECQATSCETSTPTPSLGVLPLPLYLRALGWSCLDNCKYGCAHGFTDKIKVGGRWHQCEWSLWLRWCRDGRGMSACQDANTLRLSVIETTHGWSVAHGR